MCSIRRNYCKYFRGVADLIHHRLHFVLFRVFLYQDLVYARRNSYPWCILCQDLGFFDHFIVQGFVFSEHVWTFIHPGLLYTPGKVYASMLNDLAISRGEEEIEKPDFQSSLIQTLPRRGFLLMQTKPGLFFT